MFFFLVCAVHKFGMWLSKVVIATLLLFYCVSMLVNILMADEKVTCYNPDSSKLGWSSYRFSKYMH